MEPDLGPLFVERPELHLLWIAALSAIAVAVAVALYALAAETKQSYAPSYTTQKASLETSCHTDSIDVAFPCCRSGSRS